MCLCAWVCDIYIYICIYMYINMYICRYLYIFTYSRKKVFVKGSMSKQKNGVFIYFTSLIIK